MNAVNRGILAVIETFNNSPVAGSLEVLGFALELSRITEDDISIIVPGSSKGEIKREIIEEAGLDIFLITNPHLDSYHHEVLVKGIQKLAESYKPKYICFPGTVFSGCIAPHLASIISSPYISSVEKIEKDKGSVVFTRSVYGEKYVEEIISDADMTVVMARPGHFPMELPGIINSREADIKEFSFDYNPENIKMEGIVNAGSESTGLNDADVIISAGRGAGSEESIELLREVSQIFRNSALGGSRPVCDMGRLPYTSQIGTTGRSVSPELYFACGISGSSQHLAGMKNSGLIVAVNSDTEAPITSIADYIIVDDLEKFLPVLINKYKEIYQSG
jgi:electron transfer flavoprotein alpha subunit